MVPMTERLPAPYPVPAGPIDAEIVITRSRFLAALRPVATRAAALAELERIRAAYPDATHHCFAYLVGSPQSGQAAMSDDGEPSGTAGRPIFSVIGHKAVGDVLIVVTRYFGGVKLGAGGLVRAYSAAAEAAASRMVVVDKVVLARMTLQLPFADEQAVRHWCSLRGAEVEAVEYGQAVRMTLAVPAAALVDLREFCAGRGVLLQS